MSLQRGRRFYGCELKPEYHAQALRNLAKAERTHTENSKTMFDAPEAVA
jgi:DNA modification methylase